MPAARPKILIVGITGMLGAKIARAFLESKRADLRALVRDPSDKVKELEEWTKGGVEVAEGDVSDRDSLLRATEGIDGIVSALNNKPELIVDGQTNLLRAAEQNGVRRFIPSDFAADYRKVDYGDNDNFDMRKRFFEVLTTERGKVEYTSVLNGAFTEMLVAPGFKQFDKDAGVFRYWGEEDQLLDYTTTDDTAQYVVEAIFDPGMANQALQVAGDQVTSSDLRGIFERAAGKPIRPERLGSTDDLRREVDKVKPKAKDPWEYLALQYTWTMVTGKAKLDPVMNDRYPQIRPQKVEDFLKREFQTP